MTAISLLLSVLIGTNYNSWLFGVGSPGPCPDRGELILASYNLPGVRDAVRKQLAEMHRAGFTSLRTFVWHPRTPYDAKGYFVSPDGNISDDGRERIRAFVSDVAAAGFSSLEVGPNFSHANFVLCKHVVPGDCFDPSLTDENWRFIEQTAKIALGARGSMAVRFDLQNEAAPPVNSEPQYAANTRAYLTTIARRFQDEFGPLWLISATANPKAPDVQLKRTMSLLDDLQSAGLTPPLLEIHEYSEDPSAIRNTLDEIQSISQRIGAHFVVGEMLYHNATQANTIIAWERAHPQSRLIDVMYWPLVDFNDKCAAPPPPPYTPGPLAGLSSPP